ncbi:MAG: hypothetical protein HY548_00025 [Elusimicrobia bacterium]|nr:hypothetical protein [Elusimicrobiota bacterium]
MPGPLQLTLKGQIPSGKNHMKIDPRTGQHYPNKRFSAWRQAAWVQLRSQPKAHFNVPCRIQVDYWPGDRRRRDVPGMEDALCHILEYSQILKDDSLLQDWEWTTHEVSPTNPRVILRIEEKV